MPRLRFAPGALEGCSMMSNTVMYTVRDLRLAAGKSIGHCAPPFTSAELLTALCGAR